LANQKNVGVMLEGIQRHEIIEESHSPWSSPVVLVRKKNEDLSFCADYRKLNDVTKKDCFLLPWIEDTLDMQARAKWSLNLNLRSSYWQVELHPDDKKTVFSTDQGLWQFTIMSLGLCNPPPGDI
jgi:hypothetical protein